jgi:hypothetical protein
MDRLISLFYAQLVTTKGDATCSCGYAFICKKEKQFVENSVFPGNKVTNLSIAIIILLLIIY